MRHWKTSLAAVVVAGLLAATAALAAQSGNIKGSVENERGQAWEGVSVTLVGTTTSAHFATKTDEKGKFSFKKVPAGDYTISFNTGKYPPQPSKITVKGGRTMTVDFNLQKMIAKNPKLAGALRLEAQSAGNIKGTVEDDNGKPWDNVKVTITHAKTNASFTATTNAQGQYSFLKVPAGDYKIVFDTPEYPPQQSQIRVTVGGTLTEDLNFKKLLASNPKIAEQLKKQKQFANLKQHFQAGMNAMKQVKSLQQQMNSEPAAKKAATQQQITQLSQTAVSELQVAQKALAPNDPNTPIILGNLGLAYELSGKHAQAATAFSKAAQLKPTDASLFMGAATNLAYSGNIKEASADCEKAVAISPQSGGSCWRNIGVVLYNSNHMKEAVGPLQKATKADPTDADAWYLLGESLMNNMQSKMVNGKVTAVAPPGTAEAFQKYLKLAPNGPEAPNAKQALQVLQQLGGGVNATSK